MKAVGIGYRRGMASWLEQKPAEVECLEITAEHFYDRDLEFLRNLRWDYPLFVHGLGLSLGTPGPLDEENLAKFKAVVDAADPVWISEHVAFTRTPEVDLGHLNPVCPDQNTLAVFVDHARELAQRCAKPLILENITSHLQMQGSMSEAEFLNEICAQADCGLLLDVTNLFINSKNHGFQAKQWLTEINPTLITQLHIVGYGTEDGRWKDNHTEPIQDEIFELLDELVQRANVQAIIIERDDEFPSTDIIAHELCRLRELLHVD
jgi:uncharacterized protein (UPF0276 family)